MNKRDLIPRISEDLQKNHPLPNAGVETVPDEDFWKMAAALLRGEPNRASVIPPILPSNSNRAMNQKNDLSLPSHEHF